MVVAKVGSAAVKTAADNPGAGILLAIVGLLVIANVFRTTTAQVEGVIEGARELPGRGWDAIKPEPFPYNDWGDFWDDIFSPATDMWDRMPWVDDDQSDYIDPGAFVTPVPRPLVQPIPDDLLQAIKDAGGLI